MIMTEIPFTKMHGLGNDYIYIDKVSHDIPQTIDWPALSRRWSNRHTGIGGDGIVLIEPSEVADFRMRIFNADGSEAQMCGNASRCIGKYVYERGLTDKTEVRLETLSGVKILRLQVVDEKVKNVQVDMGKPLNVSKIAVPLQNGNVLNMLTVDMGNPHAVLFVDTLADIPVEILGPEVECHPLFPEHTNVEFAEVLSREEVTMRVWERGSGETMACGTGACAVAVAARYLGRTDDDVTMHLRGGDLQITMDENKHVLMTGGAEIVFDGQIKATI